MERNWFEELGLKKLALSMTDFYPELAAAAGRSAPRVVDVPFRAASGSYPLALRGTAPLAAGGAPARAAQMPLSRRIPTAGVAGKSGLLGKLFPKGSGKSALLGALIPLGLLLASRLFTSSSDRPTPAWAQMYGGRSPR